jgi:hypothetical protein
MGAITAASTYRENVGSLTLIVANFTTVTGDDTYASGIGTGVVAYWAQDTNAGGSTTADAGINVTNSSGTFKFQPGLAASPVTLFILARN